MVSSSKVEYVGRGQLIATNYVKNSKAIGFLWAIFSICYSVLSIIVFVQPQWIGSRAPSSTGYFGLWKNCHLSSIVTDSNTQTEFICRGRLDDFASITNPAFRAATAFMGISTIVSILSVFGLILFVCAPVTVAYSIVSWMQTISALCSGISLVIFPVGWDSPEVKLTCGPDAGRYNLGLCGIRWAYILAIIALMDGVILAILGFILGSRHIKLANHDGLLHSRPIISKRPYGTGNGSIYGSYSARGGNFFHQATPSVTNYSYVTNSNSTKRSMNQLQPIFLLPPESTEHNYDYGQMTNKSRSSKNNSLYRSEYATPHQNFQL